MLSTDAALQYFTFVKIRIRLKLLYIYAVNPLLSIRLIFILFGVLGLSLMAQYTLELPDTVGGIPITGQSFAVLMITYFLGLKDGSIAIVIYLLVGVLGLPVFADGASGLDVMIGNSGGFLYGFLFSCLLTNALLDNRKVDIKSIFQFMVFATLIILVLGGLHLRIYLEWSEIWIYGIEPFLPGAMIKILAATLVAYGVRRYLFTDLNSEILGDSLADHESIANQEKI